MRPVLCSRDAGWVQVMGAAEAAHAADRAAAPERLTCDFYTITFLPPLVINNTLPCALTLTVTNRSATAPKPATIQPGCSIEVYHINVAREKALLLDVFPPGCTTPHHVALPRRHQSREEVAVEGCSGAQQFRALFVALVDPQCGQVTVEVSSSCWLMNKTGLPIEAATKHPSMVQRSADEAIVMCPSTRDRHAAADEMEAPILLGHASAPLHHW